MLRKLPHLNFIISTTALSFQVFVLYPWHEQLNHEFSELKKSFENIKHLQQFNIDKLHHNKN